MLLLAIESSCDETAIAILEEGKTVLSKALASQVKSHAKHGGVVPENASRMHAEVIHNLIDQALSEAKKTLKDLDAIAVTFGPGLEGALLVGLAAAKTLATVLNIPLIPVNHLHGHIYSTAPSSLYEHDHALFPSVILLVSGGHSLLIHAKDHFDFEILGNTRDDAAGEAFDKVARALGLGYPGGPAIEDAAKEGNSNAFQFPRAMKNKGLEFSFSGLKTAVMQQIEAIEGELPVADLAASFQAAVSETLSDKAIAAAKTATVNHLLICGGVSANQYIMAEIREKARKNNITVSAPPSSLCTDNAVMIALAAHYGIQTKALGDCRAIQVNPSASILDRK